MLGRVQKTQMTTFAPVPVAHSNGAKQEVVRLHANGSVDIHVAGKWKNFNCEGKGFAHPDNPGEVVYEHVGLASKDENHREDISWATAKLTKGSCSPEHWHNNEVEEYYVVAGKAKITIQERIESKDGEIFTYADPKVFYRDASKGQENSVVIIPAGSRHKLENVGPGELIVVVKCLPAWSVNDCHLVKGMDEAKEEQSTVALK